MPAREAAPAKINLSLRVLGRRPDGYHELQSLVVFADCGDVLAGEPAADLRLDIAGPFASALAGDPDNLVLRAARLLADHLGRKPGAHLALEKNLPVASGIGGGSADAAAALRLLARLWNAEVTHAELASLALRLGADVPVCLDGSPAMMRGRGESIVRIHGLPRFWLVLANPRVAVSTADVFRLLAAPDLGERSAGREMPPTGALDALIGWLDDNGNDLEAPALKLAPVIVAVIEALASAKDCRLARMSGSGATCFGLFEQENQARAAQAAIARARPDWWVASSAAFAVNRSG
jgi:4-diphosphocytidyl-2-C-methyl-D-erythritol kinase